jgi:hypothetical protein
VDVGVGVGPHQVEDAREAAATLLAAFEHLPAFASRIALND